MYITITTSTLSHYFNSIRSSFHKMHFIVQHIILVFYYITTFMSILTNYDTFLEPSQQKSQAPVFELSFISRRKTRHMEHASNAQPLWPCFENIKSAPNLSAYTQWISFLHWTTTTNAPTCYCTRHFRIVATKAVNSCLIFCFQRFTSYISGLRIPGGPCREHCMPKFQCGFW